MRRSCRIDQNVRPAVLTTHEAKASARLFDCIALSTSSSPQGAGTDARVCYNPRLAGEMDERFKSHAWKACLGSNLTGVRIPVSPPEHQRIRASRPVFRFYPPKSPPLLEVLSTEGRRWQRPMGSQLCGY